MAGGLNSFIEALQGIGGWVERHKRLLAEIEAMTEAQRRELLMRLAQTPICLDILKLTLAAAAAPTERGAIMLPVVVTTIEELKR